MWLAMPTVSGASQHPFTVASSAADPAWANSMLLQCKSTDPWAHVRSLPPLILECSLVWCLLYTECLHVFQYHVPSTMTSFPGT